MSARTATGGARLAGVVVGVLALLTGCVSMPTEGPVVESQVDPDADSAPGISYDPLPPQPDQSASEIVDGFLEAMKATPIGTSVALQFLSSEAQASWRPGTRILTYAEFEPVSSGTTVTLELSDVNHYDERGAYVRSQDERRLEFGLSVEDGEWRIDQPPDALVVPASWFDDWYERVSLYYFDQAAEILVPEPVFVPTGDQLASSLVRGLLSPVTGPSADVLRTFFPPDTDHGLSVPVEDRIADVSLTGDPDAVDEETAGRMLTQLVWTLRQDPGISAVELRVGGRPFSLTEGATQVLDVGAAYDPTGAAATNDLFALQDGLLVRGPFGAMRETLGPLGQADLGVRSFAVDIAGTTAAAVTGGGSALVLAPVDQAGGQAQQVLSGAADLITPAWDHRQRTWVVDRAGGRARVYVVVDGTAQLVDVPGVTGRDVTEVLISRDGTRLVVVLRGREGDRIVASRVRHDATGRVLGVLPGRRLALAEGSPRVRDLAWRSPTTVSVLSISGELSEVRTVSVDGAPGEIATEGSTRSRGRASLLVSSPLPPDTASAYTVSGRSIADLTIPERSLPEVPPGMTRLRYAG